MNCINISLTDTYWSLNYETQEKGIHICGYDKIVDGFNHLVPKYDEIAPCVKVAIYDCLFGTDLLKLVKI